MRLSIQHRLTLGSLFLYGLMLFGVVLGLIYLVRVDDESKAVLADNYDSVRHLHGMQTELDGANTYRANAIIGIDSLLSAQEKNITEPGEEVITARLRSDFERWKTASSAAPALRADIDQLLRLNLDAIARKSELAQDNARHALFWLFLAAILIILVGLGFSVAFPSVMSAPIVRLKEAAKQMAAHNYRHRIPPFRMKELDELAMAFNEMAGELEAYDNSNLARLMAEKDRAEAVINSLRDPSIGISSDGRILFANPSALAVLGLNEADLLGRKSTDVAQRDQLFSLAIDAGNDKPFHANVHGTEQFFVATAQPIEGGKGTVHVLHNVTVFHERDRAKTDFLATISHELKTPLASTDIGLKLLERESVRLSDEQRAILADLRKDQQRLTRIVGELLVLAQAETGRIRINMGDLALAGIVENAIDAVKTQATQKDIHFDRGGLPSAASVKADADKATWVLVNLLSNAVRHSPDAGIISIAAHQEGDVIKLSVSDQGPGIPVEEQARMFQRFVPGSAPKNGSGLGLSIAHEFMAAMGGSIALEHSSPTGTTFSLRFHRAGSPT